MKIDLLNWFDSVAGRVALASPVPLRGSRLSRALA
jgi:hypothetical protein